MKEKEIKKIYKKFTNFAKEEQWLQNMLQDGWVLKTYTSEDIEECKYIFEPIKDQKQMNRIYKIDYRVFNKKDGFQEYNSIFEDAGWTSLAKSKWYSKHIFYTELPSANQDIFSDIESYIEREKRKMSTYLMYIIISIMIFMVMIILYTLYNRSSLMGVGIFALISCLKCTLDYFKHRKVYKSLV
ncbi:MULTISPECIES: DUF2812 domain-containing protein [Heyndrickxia]|uniref:DUF2812 domain-containing protein n=1 Tax=Heyndrickxia TaxID=2837504 RepID=UPI00203E172E|nr:DUF2812 domain-containing protein [Heyndrickxia oleronia]MCI1593145.1 DUF2812 domain-containing protein [Heyndrickxia oleronia]MCI1612471.1 DUF2812 domain-containing protein [Heyndrickxia oleronia]MCI1743699.1 DUF2812 domain-containing protein [Heyndrickxia oleronia]MCI1760406.1 DUF2812 domain-containing protein [Heyndrickxia oleronia]MCM3455836.1 DUF2812 domain-containing protein [Heyndrickxia oleronia]